MFHKTEEFEVDGGERERTQWRWSLRGVAIHLKQLLSLTPAIASQRGVAGGVRLERGVNGVVTELLMLRWIQVQHASRTLKRGGIESRHNMFSLEDGADA